jgi:SAM-dependent methyltransferase
MEDKRINIFDNFSDNYHQSLNDILSISGENTAFFAIERVKWMKQKIARFFPELKINKVLDYGCGTGDTLPVIDVAFHPDRLIGADLSVRNIELASKNHTSYKYTFCNVESIPNNLKCELVYCNGVFHHIPIKERNKAANIIYNSLTSNGILAFWENNPWNPGARYIMYKCPFDENAISVSPVEAKRLLKENGFKIIDVSFNFIFPKSLNFLRFSEKTLSSFPIGAQYLILALKVEEKKN